MTQQNRSAAAPGFLMTHEAAEILNVSPKTVSRWAKEGKLPFSWTLGGHRRYPDKEIRALVALNTVPAEPPSGTPGYTT